MKWIDGIHMASPEWDCRKVRERLKGLGFSSGRRHCNTLFRKLGIHCSYRKPRTTIRRIGHKVYPPPAKTLGNSKAQSGLWAGHHVTPYGKRFYDPDLCHGHLQETDSVQSDRKRLGCKFLSSWLHISSSFVRLTGPIRDVCGSRGDIGCEGQVGWKRGLDRQHFHRAILALAKGL